MLVPDIFCLVIREIFLVLMVTVLESYRLFGINLEALSRYVAMTIFSYTVLREYGQLHYSLRPVLGETRFVARIWSSI